MSTHPAIGRICVIAIVICLILTVLFMNGEALGIRVDKQLELEEFILRHEGLY